MRRAAGFHADKAGLDLRKEPVHFRARQLALQAGELSLAKPQALDLRLLKKSMIADGDGEE